MSPNFLLIMPSEFVYAALASQPDLPLEALAAECASHAPLSLRLLLALRMLGLEEQSAARCVQ